MDNGIFDIYYINDSSNEVPLSNIVLCIIICDVCCVDTRAHLVPVRALIL